MKLEEKPEPPPVVEEKEASLNLRGSQKSIKSMGLTPIDKDFKGHDEMQQAEHEIDFSEYR